MSDRPSPLGPEYWRFWLASASSNLGDGVRLAALPLLALSLTDDARLIAATSAVTILPWFVIGPIAGAFVDRADRRRLMYFGQTGRALLVVALVILISTDQVTIWWVLVVAFGLGVGEVVVDSASQAAVPLLVTADQLDRANARLIAAVTLLDQVIGVALGAVLFSVAVELPFVIDAATFVVGAALLVTIRRPLQGSRNAPATIRADISEGFRFMFGHKLLRGIMFGVGATNMAGNISLAVMVILVIDDLGASEAMYGFIFGVGAIGGVLGSLSAGRLVKTVGRARLMRSLHPVLIGTLVAYAYAPNTAVIAIGFGASSFVIVVFNVPAQSLRQVLTPERLLGRVVTVMRMVGIGLATFGALSAGFITNATDVRTTNLVAAAVMTVAWGIMLSALRHLDPPDRPISSDRTN